MGIVGRWENFRLKQKGGDLLGCASVGCLEKDSFGFQVEITMKAPCLDLLKILVQI